MQVTPQAVAERAKAPDPERLRRQLYVRRVRMIRRAALLRILARM